MAQTPIYLLDYFTVGQTIGEDTQMDERRFRTVENQLYNIYTIFGNGIIERTDPTSGVSLPSWELSIPSNAAAINTVRISEGQGNVSFKYAETTVFTDLILNPPIGFTQGSLTFYIYVKANSTTPNAKTVDFISSFTVINDPNNYVGLGGVIVTFGSNPSIQVFNTPDYGRTVISILSSLGQLVLKHKHVGGSNNPSPIDLSKHVTNKLSGDNISNLDLSQVTSGVLDPNRLPQIDHSSLTNIGTLTHDNIDTLLSEILYPSADYSLSAVSIANRLQVILGLKKQTGLFNIDASQFGAIFYMPYSQLNNFYDIQNTTALIDTITHQIVGQPGQAPQSNFIQLKSNNDFDIAIQATTSIKPPLSPQPHDVVVVSNNTTSPTGGLFQFPTATLIDNNNNLYVSDTGNDRIQILASDGSFVYQYPNNLIVNDPLSRPTDMVGLGTFLYVLDTLRHRLVLFDIGLNFLKAVGANNGSGVPGNGNGQFNEPAGIAISSNSYIYVVDSGNNRIQKFDTSGNYINQYTWSSNPTNSTIFGLYQGLNSPTGIAVSNNSNLYLCDSGNSRVIQFQERILGGSTILYANYIMGKNTGGRGYASAPTVQIVSATGISAAATAHLNADGQVYKIVVTNSGTGYAQTTTSVNLIQASIVTGTAQPVVNSSGLITDIYVQYGNVNSNFTSVGSNNEEFNSPKYILCSVENSTDVIYISDTYNSRITKYKTTTFADSYVGMGYTAQLGLYGTGAATTSSLYMNQPLKMQFNYTWSPPYQTLFIVDSLNNRILAGVGTFKLSGITLSSVTSVGGPSEIASPSVVQIDQSLNYTSLNNLTINFIGTSNVWSYATLNTIEEDSLVTGGAATKEQVRKYLFNQFVVSQSWTNVNKLALSVKLDGDPGFKFGKVNLFLLSSTGTTENLTKKDGTALSITRSNFVQVYDHENAGLSQTFFLVLDLSSFTGINFSQITGFGLSWDTQTGWLNTILSDVFLYPPSNDQVAGTNEIYADVLSHRQQTSDNSPIYIWNYGLYAQTGVFLFRFDSGPSNSGDFRSLILTFNRPAGTSISVATRMANTLADLDLVQNLNSATPLSFVSGQNLQINLPAAQTYRFIDIYVTLTASSDLAKTPQLSTVTLFYKSNGTSQGITWDTDLGNAPVNPITLYPRVKWSSGTVLNGVEILNANNANGDYYIQIEDTAKVGKYRYLNSTALREGYYTTVNNTQQSVVTDFIAGFENSTFKYITPVERFRKANQSLFAPLDYYQTDDNKYYIADTNNDRILVTDDNDNFLAIVQGNIRLARKERDFVVLGAYYNPTTQYLFIPFSQWIKLAADGSAINNVSIQVGTSTFLLSNTAYFSAYGLWRPDSQGLSATFYAKVTSALNQLIVNLQSATIIIQNPSTAPPFVNNGHGNDPDTTTPTATLPCPPKETILYQTNGSVSCVTGLPDNTNDTSVDPVHYASDINSFISTLLDYQYPFSKTLITLPVYIGNVYFENIYAPMAVQVTGNGNLVVTTVGNLSVRSFDSNFNQLWNINSSVAGFNEFLGGNAWVVDSSLGDSEELILLSTPELSNTSSVGKVRLYNRISNTFLYEVTIPRADPVRSLPINNNQFYTLTYDRLTGGKQSQLIQFNSSGQNLWQYGTNILLKPTGFRVLENGNFIIANGNGPNNTVNFLKFNGDGS